MKYFCYKYLNFIAYVLINKNCVYREKMSSETVNLVAFIYLIMFVTHKIKTRKNQKTKTYLNETMAEKTETIEVHVLTCFQNIC